MSFLTAILTDLKDKRLWPVVVVLVAALVAVPVLLSKSGSAHPPAVAMNGAAAAPATASPATAVPAVSVGSSPGNSHLKGHPRDPFTQQVPRTAKTTTTTTTTSSTTAAGATSSSGSTGSKSSTATGGAGTPAAPKTTTPTTTTTTTTTTTPTVTPKPTPTGLTATQSYHVTVSLTNAAGGLDTIDPLERLGLVPSTKQQLLIELGVLKGGHRVLFVIQPGTLVSGPGKCTPGTIDCEILSLAQDQVEQLSTQTPDGVVAVGSFAVTAIGTDEHSSAVAADKARRTESAAGRDLLSKSTLGALSLFQYEPSLGAVVDLRDLTVGGS